MTFSRKSTSHSMNEELARYNGLMKKLGRPTISASASRKSKKKVSQKLVKTRSQKSRIHTSTNYDDQYRKPNLPSTSDKVVYSNGKTDYTLAFERGQETQSTIDAIKEKASCTAPLYSKGAYQYVTPKTNTSEIGRKI